MFTTHKAKLPPDDKTADESTVPDAAAGEAAVKAVTILVQALATAQMYGVAHKVTGQMLEQGFPLLAESLAKIGRLTLTVTGEELLANGALFASHASQTAGLARRIQALGLPALTLNRGFSLPELEKLLALLTAPKPSAGKSPLSAQTLRDAGLSHVSVQTAGALRSIGEDEQVVKRNAAQRLHAGAASKGTPRGASAALLKDARAFLQSRAADRTAEPCEENAPPEERSLALILSEVGRSIQPGGPQLPAADIRTILQRAARRALAANVSAQRTLQLIETKSREPAPDAAKYKELIALIAELAQELSQPLTIVTATLDMIRRCPPANDNEGQAELLAMASDSGKQLSELVARLVQIAGTPESLSPDAERLKTIYQAAGT